MIQTPGKTEKGSKRLRKSRKDKLHVFIPPKGISKFNEATTIKEILEREKKEIKKTISKDE